MGKQNSKLPPNDLAELAKITDFDEHEIQLWFKSFKNDCPNGKLDFNDFQKLYNKFFPAGDASAFAKYTFRTFDQNGDGSIDFREFMCALSVTSRGNFEEKLRWAFNMYDLDGDGEVSKKEISELVTAIYRMVGDDTRNALIQEGITPEERVDRIFTKMDKDGDATITEVEFKFAALADPTLVMIIQNAGC